MVKGPFTTEQCNYILNSMKKHFSDNNITFLLNNSVKGRSEIFFNKIWGNFYAKNLTLSRIKTKKFFLGFNIIYEFIVRDGNIIEINMIE